ncbi:MAG: sodium:alanine symporter family protein [Gammaproteobacteria bacterium]|nr:MAG: sodium:alanine symporter family protein [Gammaproteobacteria bacterium]
MEKIIDLIEKLNGIVWGPVMLVLILGTGVVLMAGLKGMPLLKLGYGFKMLWSGRDENKLKGEGEISPFNALMTSLAATIGTGNIAGVATAIFLGGPGALFWMWMTALVGMATKYAEAVLAVHFRETDANGQKIGGPMYYIKNGLGKNFTWLATTFAIFGALAGFGIGNTIQANSVADVLSTNLNIHPLATGLVMAVLAGLVLLGGIKRIATVAGKLVPIMAVSYLAAGIVILAMHIELLPAAFDLIFTHAFTPVAATGGFAGAAVWAAIRFGVARGIFSNEAGLGSAPIAHASAKTNSPVRQGTVAMMGTFIDTILVCSVTGLVIIVSGAWTSGETGASLSSLAFESVLPGLGGVIVSMGLCIFAFTTILGWSIYGEKCVTYLFGTKSILPFRVLWIIAIPLGAVAKLSFIWLVADTLNALMAIPNLIALLLLSPVVLKLTQAYFAEKKAD